MSETTFQKFRCFIFKFKEGKKIKNYAHADAMQYSRYEHQQWKMHKTTCRIFPKFLSWIQGGFHKGG